jgi:hypothetical protein
LKKYHHDLASAPVDFDRPYVFVALHYQPEKTTCPLGGNFYDQIYMLRLLSEALPEGWSLYVKDHPSQFVSSYTRYGEHFRSVGFYQSINELSNARLIPLNTDAFTLIDRCQAVATVTGNSAWEGVIRGKPGLVFDHCWFKICKGNFYTPTLEKIVQVFEMIINGYQINDNHTKLFATVVEQHLFDGIIGGLGIRDFFDITDAQNGLAHAQAIETLIGSECQHRTSLAV